MGFCRLVSVALCELVTSGVRCRFSAVDVSYLRGAGYRVRCFVDVVPWDSATRWCNFLFVFLERDYPSAVVVCCLPCDVGPVTVVCELGGRIRVRKVVRSFSICRLGFFLF